MKKKFFNICLLSFVGSDSTQQKLTTKINFNEDDTATGSFKESLQDLTEGKEVPETDYQDIIFNPDQVKSMESAIQPIVNEAIAYTKKVNAEKAQGNAPAVAAVPDTQDDVKDA